MAQRKNKSDIHDSIIDKELSIEVTYWLTSCFDDWDWDHFEVCDVCGSYWCPNFSCCEPLHYLEDNETDYVYLSKRFGRWCISNPPRLGSFIDLTKIYSKEVLRNKKIEWLLGIEKFEMQTRPTLGDICNFKK